MPYNSNRSKLKEARQAMSPLSKLTPPVLIAIALLYIFGAWLRLGDVHAPGVLVEREFRSSIIARSMYFAMAPPAERWRADVAKVSWRREGRLEPPLTELLAAVSYWLTGNERPWLGHVIPSLFWLAGGPLVFSIALRIVSPGLALWPLGYYLLAPLGVVTSRSFQPDSLMILLLLVSLHAMLRYADRPSRARLAWAVAASASAVLVKPLVVFMILVGFLFLRTRNGSIRGLVDATSILFIALSLAPTIAWYGYSSVAGADWEPAIRAMERSEQAGSMVTEQFLRSFRVDKLVTLSFWKNWFRLTWSSVGYVALPAGLIGLVLMRKGATRILLAGLWVGYFVFGLTNAGRIDDHGYYNLQLIPVVGLSMAPLTAFAWNTIRGPGSGWIRTVPLIALTLIWAGFAAREVQRRLKRAGFESPEICRAVGTLVGHSTRTVYLSHHYGVPLTYYGELSGAYWPKALPGGPPRDTRPESVEERLDRLTFEPEYFIVTVFWRFERYHGDLKAWLQERCRLLADEEHFKIWSDCNRR